MQTDHIFIIDDDKFFAKYFIKKFELIVNDKVEFHHFTSLTSVFTASLTIKPSLIFLDNFLKEGRGFESIPELCKRYPEAELILISASKSQELIEKAHKNGASQFIFKDDLLMKNISERLTERLSRSKKRKLWTSFFKP